MDALLFIPEGYFIKPLTTIFSLTVLFAIGMGVGRLFKSQKVLKFFSAKTYIGFVVAIILGYSIALLSAFSERSENSTRKFRSQLNEVASSFGLSGEQKNQFVDCALEKYRDKFPDGFEKIGSDSVTKIGKQIGRDCFMSLTNVKIGWTPAIEEAIRARLVNNPELEQLDLSTREKFANCYIEKLKAKHPEGIIGELPDEEVSQLGEACVEELSK